MSFETRIVPDTGLSLRRLFVTCPGRMLSSEPPSFSLDSSNKSLSIPVHSALINEEDMGGHVSMDVLDHIMQTLAVGATQSSSSGVRGATIAPTRVEVAGEDSFLVLEVTQPE